MTLFPSLAILGLALLGGVSGARAQQAIGLVATNSFNLYGLNVDVSSCSIGLNGANPTACMATNKLELLQVVSPTNTLTFDVVGYSGSSPGSATSAALSATSGTSQLNLTLLVTPNSSYHTSTTRVTGATLTSVGDAAFAHHTDGTSAQASAAFSAGTTATQLTAALTPVVGTASQQTVVSGPSSFSPSSASFTITENLELNPNDHSVNLLSLNSVALRFTTTPEPASIALLLAGLAGIAVVRRRRTSRSRSAAAASV